MWQFLVNNKALCNYEVAIIKNILICLTLRMTTTSRGVYVYKQNLCVHDMWIVHNAVCGTIYVSYTKQNVICGINRNGKAGYLSEENSEWS